MFEKTSIKFHVTSLPKWFYSYLGT